MTPRRPKGPVVLDVLLLRRMSDSRKPLMSLPLGGRLGSRELNKGFVAYLGCVGSRRQAAPPAGAEAPTG